MASNDTMPLPLEAEVTGDWSGFKGDYYHVLYALWLLLVKRVDTVSFYAGNDILSCEQAPKVPLPTGESCGILDRHGEIDHWIQVKNQEHTWSMTAVLTDTVAATFVWNALLSRSRGRSWTVSLVSPTVISTGDVRDFLADSTDKPRLRKALESVRDAIWSKYEECARDPAFPLFVSNPNEIDTLLREVLRMISECRTHTLGELRAELELQLAYLILEPDEVARVLRALIGAVVEAASAKPSEPLVISVGWLEDRIHLNPLTHRGSPPDTRGRRTARELLLTAQRGFEAMAKHDPRFRDATQPIDRVRANRWLASVVCQTAPQRFLLGGEAGIGKTSWVIDRLRRLSQHHPIVWSSAGSARLGEHNAIERLVCRVLFGQEDGDVAVRLGAELRHLSLRTIVVLDGIDELRDLRDAARSIRDFSRSPLDPYCHVLMTCRTEALQQLSRSVTDERMKLFSECDGLFHELEPLTEVEAREVIARWRAPVDAVLDVVPSAMRGNPLFLSWAVQQTRSSEVLSPADDLVRTQARWCLREARRLLKEGGSAPQEIALSLLLESMAHEMANIDEDMLTSEQIRPPNGVATLDEGESSILGRLVQVGALAERSGGYAFGHPLLREEFLARAAERTSAGDWVAWIGPRNVVALRGTLVRIVKRLKDPSALVAVLADREERVAVQCAQAVAHRLTPTLRSRLCDVSRKFLAQPFTEERVLALGLLEALKEPPAGAVITSWFAALSTDERGRFGSLAGRALLRLEHAENCFPIVMLQPELFWQMYSSRFVQDVEDLSYGYRGQLSAWLYARLPSVAPDHRETAITMLAALRDQCLLSHLAQVSEERELESYELRALIHLDTFGAVELYEVNARRVMRRVRAAPEDQRRSWQMLESLVFFDVHHHRSACLTDFVERLLDSDDLELGLLAAEWVRALAAPRLLRAYLQWAASHGRVRDEAATAVVSLMEPREAVALFSSLKADERAQTVLLYALASLPGAETEELLLSLLQEGHLLSPVAFSVGGAALSRREAA